MVTLDRARLHQVVDDLPDDALEDAEVFLMYLRHQKTHPGSAWFRTIAEILEPTRKAIAETGLTEEEINRAIDEAIAEVRRESTP